MWDSESLLYLEVKITEEIVIPSRNFIERVTKRHKQFNGDCNRMKCAQKYDEIYDARRK